MRWLGKATILTLCMTLLYLGCVAVQPAKLPKKLIEFGWDVPTPDFVKQTFGMEKRPFDGIVINLKGGEMSSYTSLMTRKNSLKIWKTLEATTFQSSPIILC